MPASTARTKNKSKKQLNTTAYLLGFRAVWLPSSLETIWAFAEPDQPLPQHLTSTVARLIRDLEELSSLLPAAKKTRLLREARKAVKAAWDAFYVWQGEDHRLRMTRRDASEPEAAWEAMLDGSELAGALQSFRRQLDEFCAALTGAPFKWARLGRLVATVWDLDANTSEGTPSIDEDIVVKLEAALGELKLTDIDLSEQAARERPANMTYFGWVQEQVGHLHQQIVLGGTKGKEAELLLRPSSNGLATTGKSMLTPPEIAKTWHVSADKVLAWIRSGKLRASNVTKKSGGRPKYLVHVDDLEVFRVGLQNRAEPKARKRRMGQEADPTGHIRFFE
jgi:hypothetical protein